MTHDDDDQPDIEVRLADGQIVDLQLYKSVRRLQDTGHTIAVDADHGIQVTPEVDPLCEDILNLDANWAGTAAILAQAPGVH